MNRNIHNDLRGKPRSKVRRVVLIIFSVADLIGLCFAETGIFHGYSMTSRIGFGITYSLGVILWSYVLTPKR